MNKLVIIVFVLMATALVWLGLISFGPLAKSRTLAHLNPSSVRPETTTNVSTPRGGVEYNVFHNRDLKENYYRIQFPRDWTVQSGKAAGGYALTFPGGSGTADLIDVPDNSTLELFVLSQELPRLKKELLSYRQMSYEKTTLDGHEAHRLAYQTGTAGQLQQTIRTYIGGADHGEVITLTAAANDTTLTPLFASVENSFHWEAP